MFSCRTRGFCPSCHAKRVEEWGEGMRTTLLLAAPHRQVVFTIPKRLRVFFKFDRRLLGSLCRSALQSLSRYFEIVTGSALRPGVIAILYRHGEKAAELEKMDYLEFIARVTSHIPDKGQVNLGGAKRSPPTGAGKPGRPAPLLGRGMDPALRPRGHTPLELPTSGTPGQDPGHVAARHGPLLWLVRQRPSGKGREGEPGVFAAPDRRGGDPSSSRQGLGGHDPKSL